MGIMFQPENGFAAKSKLKIVKSKKKELDNVKSEESKKAEPKVKSPVHSCHIRSPRKSLPIEGWIRVATLCFKIGTGPDGKILPVSFDDANILCSANLNYSRALQLPNWFMASTLGDLISPALKNRTEVPDGFRLTEVWTSYYFDIDEDQDQIPDKIDITGIPDTVSIYLPLWAREEPSIPQKNSNCIAYDAEVESEEFYGFRVKNCQTKLPAVCQTFACVNETRCGDNSKCIPNSARCDRITDCPDSSDEMGCSSQVSIQYLKNPFGFVNAPATVCSSQSEIPCEWHISQPPGSIISVTFINLKMLPSDELVLEGMTNGEKVVFQNHGPYTHVFSDHEIRIRYLASRESVLEEELTGNIRGFYLQYWTESFTSCIDNFDSWNGSFSTPTTLNNPEKYRSGMDCRWTIKKNSDNLISIKIKRFSLAKGDWLKIYEIEEPKEVKKSEKAEETKENKELKDADNQRLVTIYSQEALPPTSFVASSPILVFEFHSENHSLGGEGFAVDFQQTCINIHLSDSSGRIQSPKFDLENKSDFHCSWIIEPPCPSESCGITFYFDSLNLTNKDYITIQSDFKEVTVDSNSIPLFPHRTTLKPVVLQMHGSTPFFSAKISYSVVKHCTFPNITGGEITSIQLASNTSEQTFNYSCNLGFFPPTGFSLCVDGNWTKDSDEWCTSKFTLLR
ncbi:hypothetical protein FO519_003611 [Halicephalobus sp. NKZ332]|nr:hypothetical protein FO519_003611 [Halicephalobus sp. NKZ332]